jgi:hypothetical protein
VHFAFFGRTDAETRCASSKVAVPPRGAPRHLPGVAAQRTRERLDSYTQELQRHGLESVEREVRWLDELIDRANVKRRGPSIRPSTNRRTDPAHSA